MRGNLADLSQTARTRVDVACHLSANAPLATNVEFGREVDRRRRLEPRAQNRWSSPLQALCVCRALTTSFPRWYFEDQADIDRFFETAAPNTNPGDHSSTWKKRDFEPGDLGFLAYSAFGGGPGDEVITAEIDLDACADIQKNIFDMALHRQPQHYGLITAPKG